MEILSTRAALLPGNVLTIDSTLRTITIPEKICNLGVETDANVQRLRFSMPRYYETVDLSDFSVRINYQNAKGEGDVYAVTDAEATVENITFSWLVGPHALSCKGKVKFIVCLKKLDEAGNVSQAYHTTVASLPVLEGLETCECIVEEHPDVLEQILLRLDNLEKNGTGNGSTTPGPVVASGVTYLESPDASDNYTNLRDLETGPYILNGFFKPFAGSTHNLGFSKAIVSVTKKDAGSHIMVLSALNCIVNFLEIMVDDTAEGGHTYTRTNIDLPDLHAQVSNGPRYVESLAENNMVNLRDLTDGPYILYGYFHPYEGAPDTLLFDRAFASVINLTAGSHVMVYNPRNFKVDCYEVLGNAADGYTYTLENVGLLDLHQRVVALEKKSRIADVVLLAANWQGDAHPYSQVVAIDGVTANSQVDLTPSVEQLTVFYEKDVTFVAENEGGVVTVYAIGQKPANDYTIQATVTEVAT